MLWAKVLAQLLPRLYSLALFDGAVVPHRDANFDGAALQLHYCLR